MDYITPKQAAEKWQIGIRRVQELCANGKIPDAVNMGRHWIIPENAERPADGRKKKKNQIIDESYRFPFLHYTHHYASDRHLNENEKCLLKAQLLHYHGDYLGSIQLCRDLLENIPEHYLAFGAYATMAFNNIVLGLYKEYIPCRIKLEELAKKAATYPEDYRLIIAGVDFHSSLNHSAVRQIEPDRLSPEALPYYKMLLMIILTMTGAIETDIHLKQDETFCRELSLEGMEPTLLNAHSLLSDLYRLAGQTDRSLEHAEKACRLGIKNRWFGYLAKYYSTNHKAFDLCLEKIDPKIIPKIRKLLSDQKRQWRVFYYCANQIGDINDPLIFEQQLYLLLSKAYTNLSISIALDTSEADIEAKILKICRDNQLKDRAALVEYAKDRIECFEARLPILIM